MYHSLSYDGSGNGAKFEQLPEDALSGTQMYDDQTGDILVCDGGQWKKLASTMSSGDNSVFPSGKIKQILEQMVFKDMLQELAIFGHVDQERYFKLKKLYKSDDGKSRYMASNIVSALHHKMTSNG